MSFIAEWVEHFIRSGMEDPREEGRQVCGHGQGTCVACLISSLKPKTDGAREAVGWRHPPLKHPVSGPRRPSSSVVRARRSSLADRQLG